MQISPVNKLYLRLFLFFGLGFGFWMLLFDLLDGTGFDPFKLLFTSVFFGLFMSLGLATYHIDSLKKYGVNQLTDDTLSVKQKRILKSHFSKSELINRIQSDPLLKKMKLKTNGGRIEMRSSMSFKSYGEKISIVSHTIEGNETEYEITSTPVFKLTILDYGKNLKNVNLVSNLLHSQQS